jgi:hypothetical protein
MAQFLILESTNADGKATELCINIDQVCRVFTLGPSGAVESMEVHMSDGQRLILQEEAATALFAVITNARNVVELTKARSPLQRGEA